MTGEYTPEPFPPVRSDRSGFDAIAATVLMCTLTVTLVLVMVFLTPTMCGCAPPTINIGVNCVREASGGGYRCSIESADQGVGFEQVGAQVFAQDGTLLGSWPTSLKYANGARIPVHGATDPLAASSYIQDNGDLRFGVGDRIVLEPVGGADLKGSFFKVDGGGSVGSARLN